MKYPAFALAVAFTAAAPLLAADNTTRGVAIAAGAVREARQDMAAEFAGKTLRPGQYVWDAEQRDAEVTRVVLDLSRQLAFAYADDELIAVSTISSGDKNHLSPVGVFPILEKKRMHRSIRYDNAPMPFMQRINEYGVALHAGNLPGHPASHGCIRLPNAFAAKLFEATAVGTEVLIAEPEGPPTKA